MIFDAEPSHVQELDQSALVELMRRLLLAEARSAGVPLRGVSVPLQITVADGGEDGRIEWAGGKASTDYIPDRFTILQSKAGTLRPGMMKSEMWTKSSARRRNSFPPVLSAAVTEVLARRGAYIAFCGKPLAGQRPMAFVEEMRAGIRHAGGDPDQAADLRVYDANQIAAWVNRHPAVALWLASRRRGRPLQEFQTLESWGGRRDIADVPWAESNAARFVPDLELEPSDQLDPGRAAWTFDQASSKLKEHLARSPAVVRVSGPSGYGKTRFVYQTLQPSDAIADRIDAASVLYTDGSLFGPEAVRLAMELVGAEQSAILVVDECPDDLHYKLASEALRTGSQLRLVTLDIETRVTASENTLCLRLERATDAHVQEIARGVASTLRDADARTIADLAGGFPRVAVLAARQEGRRRGTLNSVEQVLDRIVWAGQPKVPEAERVLEIASLFDWIGIEGRVEGQVAAIASGLAQMEPLRFIEHLLSFLTRGIVVRRGDLVQVGPVPVAARLGERRFRRMTPDGIMRFLDGAPDEVQASMFKRLRWLDASPVAKAIVRRSLAPEGLGNLEALNSERGSECLHRLVHVDPDHVAGVIDRVFGGLSTDTLAGVGAGRRHLVWTLEKLVFRQATFNRAATLLRRLAAAETEDEIGNNASGQFKQLYNLYLSGTEAEPAARLLVLDEGLASDNERERRICVEALGAMLSTGHFSRGGGAEEIGSAEPLQDWRPRIYGEIWDFHRQGMRRLGDIAVTSAPEAARAKELLGQHVRGLVSRVPLPDVRAMIDRITAAQGLWPEAIRGLTEWLYFDRRGGPPALAADVRAYVDQLFPTDPVDAVELYLGNWHFYDPDKDYGTEARHDHDFAARKAAELIPAIAADSDLLDRTVRRFACEGVPTIFGFAKQLALTVPKPDALFAKSIEAAEAVGGRANRGFFAGLIAGAEVRDHGLARDLVEMALRSPLLKDDAIALIGSGTLTPDDLALVVSLLRKGDIAPGSCSALSYGRGLDHLLPCELLPLLEELERHGTDGLWSILEIVVMHCLGGGVPDAPLIDLLKRVLVDRRLTNKSRTSMDGHNLTKMIRLLVETGAVDARYAGQLAFNLVSICMRRGRIFYDLDHPVCEALDALAHLHAREVWSMVARVATSRSWRVRQRAEHLLVQDNNEEHLARGLSISVPHDLVMAWVDEAPSVRAPLAVEWIPVATRHEDGTLKWTVEFTRFVDRFGDNPAVLRALARRLEPSSWAGSLVPYLEPILPLLETWAHHPTSAVSAWVARTSEWLREKVTQERKSDEEDVVRYS